MEFKNILTNSGSGQQALNESKVDSYLVILGHSVKEFLKWWYVKMPLWHLRMLIRISVLVDDSLSLSLLLRNFLLPWRRDTSLAGYFFGFLIKLAYIPVALFIYIITCTGYILLILIWLLLPLATCFFIFRSLLRI